MKQHERNRARANRLANGLKTVREYEGALDWRTTIVDALSDMRHLCDKLDLDFAELDRRARDHYVGEWNLNVAGFEA